MHEEVHDAPPPVLGVNVACLCLTVGTDLKYAPATKMALDAVVSMVHIKVNEAKDAVAAGGGHTGSEAVENSKTVGHNALPTEV